jgi:hypothetical protein
LTECSVLGYTKLREIDPEAADVRLNSYKRHIERKFAREPYNLAPTINILVHEIDFVKTKEDNGELRWRFDAALQLMGLLSEALVTYMEATHRWADALAVVVDAADVQLRDIIREARLELGEDCDWYTIWELLCNEHSSTLDEDHNITTYYDKSIGDVQKILVARENAEKDS